MLSTFPDIYPDELLISVYARLFLRLRATPELTARLLFDSSTIFLKGDLPHRLSHLAAILPPWYRPTVREMIEQHTLLPFYKLCCPYYEYEDHIMDMRWHPYDRGTISQIRMVTTLRYCALCCQEDRDQVGEYYWHRSHQIPGVQVCPIHQVFLGCSEIPLLKLRATDLMSASAATSLQPTAPSRINLDDQDHRRILRIASVLVNSIAPGSSQLSRDSRSIYQLVKESLYLTKHCVHKPPITITEVPKAFIGQEWTRNLVSLKQ